MKKTFTYSDYLSDQISPLDYQLLLQELIQLPERKTALYINAFDVEYYPTPIKDGIKLVYRESDKIYICFKQMHYIKRGHKQKGDSAGFVKENADLVLNNQN